MIVRIWRGATGCADSEAYGAYVMETGIAAYRDTPGNRLALLLVRNKGELAEFITFTVWDSWDAIKNFAGEDPSKAVYYAEDERFLIEAPELVEHYEVVAGSDLLP